MTPIIEATEATEAATEAAATAATEAAATEAAATAAAEATAATEAAARAAVSQEDALPEWARKELTKVRGEAAGWRTQLRESEAKLAAAKTPEEFETATTDLRTKVSELEHAIVAAAFGLPPDLAARLRGATKAELEADAKVLQKFAPAQDPENLSGGLDPNNDDDGEMDPRVLARRHRR